MLLAVAPGLVIAALAAIGVDRAANAGAGSDAAPPVASGSSLPATTAPAPAILAPPAGTADRPGADTTDGPPPARHLAGAVGGDHRWFVGLRTQGAGGYGIGHQPPEMPAARHRIVSIVRQPPEHLVALGPRAWVIAPPLAPGTARPVYAIELRRNPVHAVWYPVGSTPLAPRPRLPAGVRPLLAAAEPTGPVVIAPPAEPGGPHRVLRLGLDRWSERPLGSPEDVPPDQLAAEVPIALAVVRAPRAAADAEAGEDAAPAPAPAPAPAGAPAGSADGATAPPGDEDSGPDPGPDSGPGAGAADPSPAPPGSPTAGAATMTMLLVAGPDSLAVDLVGRSGERMRVWSGLPEVAAARWADRGPGAMPSTEEPLAVAADGEADGEADAASAASAAADGATSPRAFDAAILDVAGEPWIALREAAGVSLRRLESPESPVVLADLRDDEPLVAALGGDGALLLAGDALDDPDRPARVRAWTPGGTEEADAALAAEQVDAGRILRGPIIIGTGIFFAVIAGVLGSRPGARPEAIEGREAGVPRRLGAALVDALAPLAAGALVFDWTPDALLASLLLLHPGGYVPWAGLTVLWAFATVVGDLGGGRTPGRLVFGVRPVDADGRPPGRGRLIVRFLVRTAAVAFPPLVLFWLAHARGRALHDLAAGTWVVRVDGSGDAAGAGPTSRD